MKDGSILSNREKINSIFEEANKILVDPEDILSDKELECNKEVIKTGAIPTPRF